MLQSKCTKQTQKTDKKKKPNEKESIVEEYDIELLANGFDSFSFFYPDNTSSNFVRLQGTVLSRVYFISTAPTYDVLLKTIKSDIISSLKRRLSLWYDELENLDPGLLNSISKDKSLLDSSALWVLPRRVFMSFRGSPICVCDYVLPSEESKDLEKIITERNMELLQNKLPEHNFILLQENIDSDKTAKQKTKEKKPSTKKQQPTSDPKPTQPITTTNSNRTYGMIAGGILLVILAWLILQITQVQK